MKLEIKSRDNINVTNFCLIQKINRSLYSPAPEGITIKSTKSARLNWKREAMKKVLL